MPIYGVKLAKPIDSPCVVMKPGEWGIVTNAPVYPGAIVFPGDPVYRQRSVDPISCVLEFPTRGCFSDCVEEYRYRPLQPGDVITIRG